MMKKSQIFFACLAALALVACDGSTDTDTDAGPMTGGDSGTMMGTDSGSMLGEPAEVAIEFGSCTDFTPCGGDPTGTWDYDSICIEDPFAGLEDACGDLTFEDVAGTARGRVTLDGTNARRDTNVTISANAIFGAGCAIAGCGTIESALAMAVDSASCASNTSGGCNCAISSTYAIAEVDGYTIEGTQVVMDDGSRYDFCASGGSMQHRELGDNPDEPGIYGLTRR